MGRQLRVYKYVVNVLRAMAHYNWIPNRIKVRWKIWTHGLKKLQGQRTFGVGDKVGCIQVCGAMAVTTPPKDATITRSRSNLGILNSPVTPPARRVLWVRVVLENRRSLGRGQREGTFIGGRKCNSKGTMIRLGRESEDMVDRGRRDNNISWTSESGGCYRENATITLNIC